MPETIMQTLARLGITAGQFCELAAISRDDLHAINEGAAIQPARVGAIVRLIKGAGRAKVAPIAALLQPHTREWKSAPGFPAYEVSDDGLVRRASSSAKGALRTLKLIATTDGYWRVTLYRHGSPEPQRVHRLVCEAFYGAAPVEKPYACHRDGMRTHNHRSNLYWGSAADNSADWQQIRRERIANAVHRKFTPAWRRQLRALESIRKSAK